MLLFSTVLDINEKMDREKFFDLIVEWNNNIYKPEENSIPNLVLDKPVGVRYGDDRLWLQFEEYESTIAAHYQKCAADGVVWDTYYVFNRRNKKLSISLERSYSEDALKLNEAFSTPFFIRFLIEKDYLKKDNDLPVLRVPTYIKEDNVSILSDAIKKVKHYRYPIVFVSKSFKNEDPVNVETLAKRLKGIAHVLVQEDVETKEIIRRACDGKNSYKGDVGIYFPGANAGSTILKYKRDVGEDPVLLERIVQTVLQYSNSQKIDPMLTWQGINSAMLTARVRSQSETIEVVEKAKNNIENLLQQQQDTLSDQEAEIRRQLHEEIQSEMDELVAIAEEDAKKAAAQIDELTKRNESLQEENDRLRNRISGLDSIPLLVYGEEQDFYPEEIKDLVLSTLDKAAKDGRDNSRRRDVLRDIVDKNEYKEITATRGAEISRILKGYKEMTPKLKQQLAEYGFIISDGGKHYQVSYYNDSRYNNTLSKTPSDWRTGKISGRDLNNMAY